MSNKICRLLSLALCAVLLCVFLPAVSASAVEFETTKEEVPVAREIGDGVYRTQEELVITEAKPVVEEAQELSGSSTKLQTITETDYSYIHFTTFEDLKTLADETYDEYKYANYQGEGALEITESLTLPDNLILISTSQPVIIAKDATLDTRTLRASALTVDGKLVTENLTIYDGELIVNGVLEFNGYGIEIQSSALIVGDENITFAESNAYIMWRVYPASVEELTAAINTAQAATNSRYMYSIDLENDLVINADITVPENAEINVWSETVLTIEEGCTLTLNGKNSYHNINGEIVVNGELVNNANISFWYDGAEAKLTIGDGGKYSGTGVLRVSSDTLIDPAAAIPGLDMSDYLVTEIDTYYWEIRSIAGMTKLGTPAELTWGYGEQWVWDPETASGKQIEIEKPGSIRWKSVAPDQNQAYIKIYREGETEPVDSSYWNFGSQPEEYHYVGSFILEDPESGRYYFTVTSKGDYIDYYDSDTATSDIWEYEKPDAKVESHTNLYWDWPVGRADLPEDMTNVGGHEAEFYYAATEDEEPRSIGASWSLNYPEVYAGVWDELIQRYGSGYYYFKVRALSSDITAACNGDWSEFSPAYYVKTAEDIQQDLDSLITSDSVTDTEIRDTVNAIDNESLRTAMLADQDNSGVVEQIADLEEKVGVETKVEVSDAAPDIDQSKVSIVGAGLNTLDYEDEDITLNIGAPKSDDHVIPTLYDSTVAVSFSMDLDNVANTEELEVPVKITLPIPAAINPDFLVILHYHVDGTMEEIWPYIYSEGGQTYAAFVLTGFSDFIMVELKVEEESPFVDVSSGAYYYDPVLWAVGEGITAGKDDTHFAPNEDCTRAQIVTFLWRSVGCPAPKTSDNPFVDVKDSAYYYNAVLWAVENGITSGKDATHFAPSEPCTRAQVATFLWRAMKNPAPKSSDNPFVDVAAGKYYYDAVLWAVENNITAGKTATEFQPNATCTRAQIVTFLYRMMVEQGIELEVG